MSRADLHNALVLDNETYQASLVDPSLLDPLIRIDGPLPGDARPIAVVREYQGPQGTYLETYILTDRSGREVFRSDKRRIELRGEMFEDRIVDIVRNARIYRGDEHTITFFVDEEELGSIPVFIEAGLGGDPAVASRETFDKAVSKGAVVWLTVPQTVSTDGRRRRRSPAEVTQAAWYVWTDGKVYVLNGETEQQIPGLLDAETVEITARSKDHRSMVSRVPATVRVFGADDERFEEIGRMALGRRLNLPDGDAALERWKQRCLFVELTPDFGEEQSVAEPAGVPAAAAEAGAAAAEAEAGGTAAAAEEDIHVEAQIDQVVYDQLIAEGKSDRIARAKAKAAFVRAEKARIRQERASA
jgi:hypothetical protein